MSNLKFVVDELLAGDPSDSESRIDKLPHQDTLGCDCGPKGGMNSPGWENIEIPKAIMATTQIQVTESELVFSTDSGPGKRLVR